jgi:hypothetical protein
MAGGPAQHQPEAMPQADMVRAFGAGFLLMGVMGAERLFFLKNRLPDSDPDDSWVPLPWKQMLQFMVRKD